MLNENDTIEEVKSEVLYHVAKAAFEGNIFLPVIEYTQESLLTSGFQGYFLDKHIEKMYNMNEA